jgi:hypothetical protein
VALTVPGLEEHLMMGSEEEVHIIAELVSGLDVNSNRTIQPYFLRSRKAPLVLEGMTPKALKVQ